MRDFAQRNIGYGNCCYGDGGARRPTQVLPARLLQ